MAEHTSDANPIVETVKGKAKSVVFTAEGHARARELFDRYFGARANKPQEPTGRDPRNGES